MVKKELYDIIYTGEYLYRWRFKSAPWKGAIVKYVTGNLVEEISAVRI